MAHLTYLALLVGCLLATLPLEFVFRARVYRRWRRAAAAILPVAVVFLIWDYAAAVAGWWFFDPAYLVGVWLGALPLEEVLFFLVIPICGILTLEAVRSLKPHWASPRSAAATRTETAAAREAEQHQS